MRCVKTGEFGVAFFPIVWTSYAPRAGRVHSAPFSAPVQPSWCFLFSIHSRRAPERCRRKLYAVESNRRSRVQRGSRSENCDGRESINKQFRIITQNDDFILTWIILYPGTFSYAHRIPEYARSDIYRLYLLFCWPLLFSSDSFFHMIYLQLIFTHNFYFTILFYNRI